MLLEQLQVHMASADVADQSVQPEFFRVMTQKENAVSDLEAIARQGKMSTFRVATYFASA